MLGILICYIPAHISVTVPDQPINVTVTSQTTTTLSLIWTNGFNGNSNITGVEIEYKEAVVTVGISLMEISIPGDASLESTYLTNLLPFQKLQYLWYTFNLSQTSTPKVDRLISKINYTLMGS